MANEMKSFTFGGVTHPIYDADSIKSAAMNGTTLELKDGEGTVKSSVMIPTGNVKFTEFKVGFSSADYGDLCYIDPTPIIGASLGDFIYVEAKDAALNPNGYWVDTRQNSDGATLKVVGLVTAPINQPLVLIVTKVGDGTSAYPYEAICVPTAPNHTFFDLLFAQDINWKDTYQKLLNWKPCTKFGSQKAFAAYSGTASNTEFRCNSSAPYGANRLFCYNDHTYAAVGFLYQGSYTEETLYNIKFDYYPYAAGGDPGPCPGAPEQLLVVDGTDTYMQPLHVTGFATEMEVIAGQGQVKMPDNILLAFGHWA